MKTLTTSVLLPVYGRDNPAFLAAALSSLTAQTRPPDEIVVVQDGPLTAALLDTIEAARQRAVQAFHIVRLEENLGLPTALNEGLRRCRGDLIIRMDADDIAFPERIERQFNFMSAHPDIDILGTAMIEFEQEPDSPLGTKPAPETHAEICRRLAWRNPINHPTVCLRRSCLPAAGYPQLRFVEDYLLWVQLIAGGCRCHNLQAPLLYYRFNAATLQRRQGWENFRNEVSVRTWMYQQGMIGLPTLLAIVIVQALLRFAPRRLRAWLWRRTRQSAVNAR